MKIRTGQLNGPQQGASPTRVRTADGRFQILLDHEMKDVVDKQPDIAPSERDSKERSYRLISDATRLLDDAIAQIETSDTLNEKTVESLQQLRNELVNLGHGDHGIQQAGIILSVEAERLKSW